MREKIKYAFFFERPSPAFKIHFHFNSWSPSASPHDRFSNPLIIFLALGWTFSSTSNSILQLGSPDLDLIWSHESWAVVKTHLAWPTGNMLPNTAQEAVGPLCCSDMLLAHVQLVHRHGRAAFWQALPQQVLLDGVICPQVQGFACPFAELLKVPADCLFLDCWDPSEQQCNSLVCKELFPALCTHMHTINWNWNIIYVSKNFTLTLSLDWAQRFYSLLAINYQWWVLALRPSQGYKEYVWMMSHKNKLAKWAPQLIVSDVLHKSSYMNCSLIITQCLPIWGIKPTIYMSAHLLYLLLFGYIFEFTWDRACCCWLCRDNQMKESILFLWLTINFALPVSSLRENEASLIQRGNLCWQLATRNRLQPLMPCCANNVTLLQWIIMINTIMAAVSVLQALLFLDKEGSESAIGSIWEARSSW